LKNFQTFTEREIKKLHSGVCEASLSNATAIVIQEEEEINENSCTCAKSNSNTVPAA
jgi:hypothetical protein